MKKILCIALALTFCLAMATVASAATYELTYSTPLAEVEFWLVMTSSVS